MSNYIDIHEFSTGINVQGSPDNWISTGFTGYMNSTLSEIPSAVQNAISNQLFKVSEGDSHSKPAIIGREVKEQKQPWSVMAVATSGKDEYGRSAAFYRYFLTEGLGGLSDILWWYLTEVSQPVFNPFDVQKANQPHQYKIKQKVKENILSKLEFKALLNRETSTLIIPYNLNCVPLIVNELGNRRKQENKLTAWAYNVGGVRKPWDFQVIYPASHQAQIILEKSLDKTKHSKSDYGLAVFFEYMALGDVSTKLCQKYGLKVNWGKKDQWRFLKSSVKISRRLTTWESLKRAIR
ncbi:hypothetical protein [Crocosphaera sp. XPORK-15E]|uniref:hypothetical protein n=1 Tax=Crocosphaera sp. XPORK-15E TaxID=3110247 RepID=UPI002B1F8A8D|nr:hypothetical protein [Crocosphaera sp. XPORK-15E]MEA5537352.1 hypothetical protein [Crocosphaera sp. XPORK-15E]